MRPLTIGSLVLLLVASARARAQQAAAVAALLSLVLLPDLERVLRDYEDAWRVRDATALVALRAIEFGTGRAGRC